MLVGPLMGGSSMSHVDFKKCQCRMSLSLIFHNITCRFQEKVMSHVTIIGIPLSHVTRSNLRNGHVALSNLGVRDHSGGSSMALDP